MADEWTRVELFAFSYFDPMRKRWTRARYRATREDIAANYPLHRLEGDPEIREGPRDPRILGR